MKFSLCGLLLLSFAVSLPAARAADAAAPTATPKPSLVHRLFHPFEKKQPASEGASNSRQKLVKGLQLVMTLDPERIVLSEVRSVKVTLRLTNRGNLRQLQFPTGQRVEAVIRDQLGAVVARWSDDQSFSSDPTFLTINPQESAEYALSLPTRDLQPGGLYSIEGSFVGYPNLTIQKSISPTK